MAWVVGLEDVGLGDVAAVGGKGAALGELLRAVPAGDPPLHVPPGFCVTTEAYRAVLGGIPLAGELRRRIEAAPVPEDLAAAIAAAVDRLGAAGRFAVRSSATAEDTPTASFAGQHDSWLDVAGADVLAAVRRCWASLFTDRAVAYRLRAGIDPRQVHMAVVVQRMVHPRAAGVVFTADPVSGHRRVAVVEAVPGLGEALVSGRAEPEVVRVRDGAAIGRRGPAVLSDEDAVRIVALARRVEAALGGPQDVEWCLDDASQLHVVQSRPITTLFPVPAAPDDAPRVYLSVGHQQVMTDAMRPLGLSLHQHAAGRPMFEAGSRLFVDVTAAVASPAGRAGLLALMDRSEPLFADALRTVIDRGFVPTVPDPPPAGPPPAPPPIEPDPALVAALVARAEASIAACADQIRTKSGPALIAFLFEDLQELKRVLTDPQGSRAILAGMEAAWWLDAQLEAWLGVPRAADVLARSVPGNVTSEMGLALLDVADAVRPHPAVVARLERGGEGFLDDLPGLPGGEEARDAIVAFLDRYGVRCVGEIDVTRPRWAEQPEALLPTLLGHVRHAEPGAARARFARGLAEAEAARDDLLARLRALPDGDDKAAQAERRIALLRTFAGYREFPKFALIRRYALYRGALLAEAERLVGAGLLQDADDLSFLTLPELRAVVAGEAADPARIRARREAFRAHQALVPPRVLTSEGEAIAGSYGRAAPGDDVLIGLGVSSGVAEGRARVILDLAGAALAPGDILVTRFTDPSWTPVFPAVVGLVTELGGQMAHGAVIAREYGLPAVVGAPDATRRIRDGQRIRVDGAAGTVVLLD